MRHDCASLSLVKLAASAAGVAPGAWWMTEHYRSSAVATWSPSILPARRHGVLQARVAGDGDRAVILLHGLVSTGTIFGSGFDQLADTGQLVVPDLLGFGGSLDESRARFSVDDHLDALDELARCTGMFERKQWVIGAHSMGSALALRWAARHRSRVDAITCWGAPVYRSSAEVEARISGTLMTRLFVLDTKWARRACALSCRYRYLAGWLTVAVEPRLPVAIARAVSLHTWPSYRDAIRELVIETDWAALVGELDGDGIQLRFVWGDADPIGDRVFARELLSNAPHAAVVVVDGGDHQLPLAQPSRCLNHLERAVLPSSQAVEWRHGVEK